jgi:hypothetical protein
MKHIIAIATFAFVAAGAHAQTPQKSAAECGVQLSKYLEMGFADFDQRAGGWREIADKPGCEVAAADVVKQYRSWILSRMDGLIGHEAQLRASAGDTANGLRLFREQLAMQDDDALNRLKLEGFIAFLERDKDRLVAARNKLAVLPEPPEFAAAAETAKKRAGRSDIQLNWPPNLAVLDALIGCFGKSFREAFVDDCDAAKAAGR